MGRFLLVSYFCHTALEKPTIFKLREHVQRLQNSAKLIGLSLPWSTEEIEAIAQDTLGRNNLPEANIRIVVTGGYSADFIRGCF
jgi:branched-chain amino acid aminotransferase